MNKELIKKYKNEFEHWLNGGKLLCYTEVEGPYYEVTDEKWDFVCDIGFIINDEYVEFRKALAEGKTIQFNFGNSGPNKTDFPNVWKDLDLSIGILVNRALPENYRIKPEEPKIPKFKVGDWVNVPAVDSIPCQFSEDLCCLGLALWQPKIGELVVMQSEDYSTGFTVTLWEENSKFVPVPFFGELPK